MGLTGPVPLCYILRYCVKEYAQWARLDLSHCVTSCVIVFRSTHGGPDWTCTIVGFSSGYVRIYTEVSKLRSLDL